MTPQNTRPFEPLVSLPGLQPLDRVRHLHGSIWPRGAVLDGAYLVHTEPPVFRRIAPPSLAEL